VELLGGDGAAFVEKLLANDEDHQRFAGVRMFEELPKCDLSKIMRRVESPKRRGPN